MNYHATMIATFYWNEEKFGNNDISEIIAHRINFWPLSGDGSFEVYDGTL